MNGWNLLMFASWFCDARWGARRGVWCGRSDQVEGEEREAEPASSTAVMMAELTKLLCSILLQYRVS